MVDASIATGRVGISCRKYVSEFLYRHEDPVPLHPADLTLREWRINTESPAFSLRHLVWLFSCSHQQMRFESSSHSSFGVNFGAPSF